ncbi:hypothetical protein, partial [Romboutsia sp.]|uniref:hypothetical protein n=1 Tax=Romboutsia sp. TaxID=1965302 RepID=UPI002BF45C73
MISLKKKIMVPVFLLSIVGTLILSFFAYNKSKDIIINYVERLAQNKAEKLALHVEDNLEKWKSAVNMLASMDTAKNMDYEGFKEYISNHKELYSKECEFFFINDKKGDYLSIDGKKGSITDRDYFH